MACLGNLEETMTELEQLAYRAKEILGSKIADLNEIEAMAFYNLENWFQKRNKRTEFERRAQEEWDRDHPNGQMCRFEYCRCKE